ncbi:hypothetical protein AQUSIP_09790 [Aquicella siphonis]|uniref:Uncharacterized protein n=1 Tax=Aquicella siphonis TaxID=254247 RepID=A0A5E4PFC7_9COXI|nr:hypothetical protein [Aquicella siphonis]VVC75689.1 hypothetical protein AQUSIP_09790 [Aquicella siphonis]
MRSGMLAQIKMVSSILGKFRFDEAVPVKEDAIRCLDMRDRKCPSASELIREIYDQIITLRSIIDNKHGISSFVTEIDGDKPVWVRYVDMVIVDQAPYLEKNIEALNYLRLFYAYLLAALALCRIYQIDQNACLQAVMHVKQIITDSFFEMMAVADDARLLRILSEGKSLLINVVHAFADQLDINFINSALDQAKDWAALERPSMRVCTIIKTESDLKCVRMIILDEPCSELTADQTMLFDKLDDQKWFNELSDFNRKLVRYHKGAILSGKCVIPSQLRAVIPLCKNSYQQTVFAQSGTAKPEIINSYFHSATAAYLSHKDEETAQTMTYLNMLQQQRLCQADAMVMICLNSDLGDRWLKTYEWINRRNYTADDSRSIKLTESASSRLTDRRVFFAKICLNYFRMIEYNNYSGIRSLTEIIKANTGKLDASHPDVARVLSMVEQVEKLQGQFTPLDLYVKGLDIIHFLTQAATLNNQLASQFADKSLQTVAVWFGCASGENRTGITYYHDLCRTMLEYFARSQEVSLSDEFQLRIFQLVAKSQHVLLMTGNQGNTFGTEGIRSKSSGSFKSLHDVCHLATKSSDIKVLTAEDYNYNQVLARLSDILSEAEMNGRCKSLIPLVRLFLVHAEEKRAAYVFMPEHERSLYNEILVCMERLLSQSCSSRALALMEKAQQSLAEVSAPGALAGQNTLLSKIIVEARIISQASQSAQLSKLGVFKEGSDTAEQKPANPNLKLATH